MAPASPLPSSAGSLILRTLHHPPPTYLLNHLLSAYPKSGRLSRARLLFDAMPDPNLFTRHALLLALAHARFLPDLERLFASMPERDVVSYNALIAGCRRSGEESVVDGVRVRPSRITMSGVVMAASALGDRTLGRQVHCHILWLGFGVYAFTRSPLVDMYARMGLIGDAKQVFDEMEGENVVMYNTMITGLIWCKMVVEARGLFEAMVNMDSITWTGVVTGLTQNALRSEALDVFWTMRAAGVGIDLYTFGSIFTACGALAGSEEGKHIGSYISELCMMITYFSEVRLLTCTRNAGASDRQKPFSEG